MTDLSSDLNALRQELARVHQAVQSTERKAQSAHRQMRATGATALAGVLMVTVLALSPSVHAQFGLTLTGLDTRLKAAETKTASISAITDPNTSQPTVRFTGVNVQVVSGSGATDFITNSTGNLIVSYNESFNNSNRTGSHNLVVGRFNDYSNFGGLVIGDNNTISGSLASVTGSTGNVASGFLASVSGGSSNLASGNYSCVSGGIGNTANSQYASVSGGIDNTASGQNASVSGGYSNTASGQNASVSGGYNNTASGDFSSVSGGEKNAAKGRLASINGGANLTVTTQLGWAAGSKGLYGHYGGNPSSP